MPVRGVSIDLTRPLAWVWLGLVVALLLVIVAFMWVGVHYLAKLDDLTHALHVDLGKAEEEIAVLQSRAVETVPDTQLYGRHAHQG